MGRFSKAISGQLLGDYPPG